MSENLCVGEHGEGHEKTAEPGSAVCTGCRLATEQGLADLPQWWADLADPNRGIRISQGSQSAEKPTMLSDDASAIRTAIRRTLVKWCVTLHTEHDVNLPDEDQIVEFTHRLILQLQDVRQDALGRGDRHKADEYAQDIAAARDTRASGADVIGGLCEHLRRHLRWLLNSAHADLVVQQITSRAGEARRAAHPSRPDVVLTCTCGSHVALRTDKIATCQNCGAAGDVNWWRDRVGEGSQRPMKITELAAWLRVQHSLDVTTRQLRNWRHRFRAFPAPAEGDGAGSTYLYDPVAVAAFVIKRRAEGDMQIHKLSA